MYYKSIIDKNGFIIERCVLFIEDMPQYFVITESMQILDMYNGNLIRPKWTGVEWIEGATDEEIRAWEENNKPVVKEPTSQDILNAKLISDNAELLKANEEQKKLNANLLLKIAMLGGNTNV
ncbi:hypothetical protein [Clostridium butyricum]|uniref:hypothetical protein n=1 Tax=Clostridium butyricum TaxID=1492 RepID=UPI002ABD4705|nr:hypothetical protein [Clostridium butyricum]